MTEASHAEWRKQYDCPSWCTSTERGHRGDDPGAPIHFAPEIRGFVVGQIPGREPTAYVHVDGELGIAAARKLAEDLNAVADWMDGL